MATDDQGRSVRPEDIIRELCLQLEDAGMMVLFVGICCPAVKNLHHRHIIVRDVSSLSDSILKGLEKALRSKAKR
jgi:hypothetical protein